MTEAVTINNKELAILCDIVGGWGAIKRLLFVPAPGFSAHFLTSDSSWVRRTSTRSFRHEIPAHNEDRDSFCPAQL
jgi:hypothetical protein